MTLLYKMMSPCQSVAALTLFFTLSGAQFFPDGPFPNENQDLSRLEENMEQLMTEMQSMAQDIEGLKSNVQLLDERVDKLYEGEMMWGTWSQFGPCSQSCVSPSMNISGFRTRTRECVFKIPPLNSHETPFCDGPTNDTVSCTAIQSCSNIPAPINQSQYIGGYGGGAFSDESIWENGPITAIRLRCGKFFDSIQARYGSFWGPIHGQDYIRVCVDIGDDYEYEFNSTEYITGIHGFYGNYMDAVTIITNERILPRCGGSGGGYEKAVTGTRLVYLKGRSGCFVDGLQPVWAVE